MENVTVSKGQRESQITNKLRWESWLQLYLNVSNVIHNKAQAAKKKMEWMKEKIFD